MRQFDKITAKFVPRCDNDLVEGALDWVGVEMAWQASWLIEDGPYEGEWAMMPCGAVRFEVPFLWVPHGDLWLDHQTLKQDLREGEDAYNDEDVQV